MDIHVVEEKAEDSFEHYSGTQTKITVVGVGGAGGNAVKRMIEKKLQNIKFIAMNTDQQDLDGCKANERLTLGKRLTKGLGAGGDPEIGEKAALEDRETIQGMLQGSDLVFITAGMGGGTGTGAAPIIASVSKELGILTIAVITHPFEFEGKRKQKIANEGTSKLREQVDTLITVRNQQILKTMSKDVPLRDSFLAADDVLRQGVQGISDLITIPGEMNIDFADVRTIMKGTGDAIMGIGFGEGSNRAIEAAMNAINHNLIDNSNIEGAQGILVNVAGGEKYSASEVDEVVSLIRKKADEDVQVITGTCIDPSLGDTLKVTVIATGFTPISPPSEPERTSSEQRKRENPQSSTYIKLGDWNQMTSTNPKDQSEAEYQGGLDFNYSNDAVNIPAYYRKKHKDNESN